MVDFFLLIQLAGTGDELQGIKRGIMEMADGIVINKADGDNLERARLAQAQFRSALRLFPKAASGWDRKYSPTRIFRAWHTGNLGHDRPLLRVCRRQRIFRTPPRRTEPLLDVRNHQRTVALKLLQRSGDQTHLAGRHLVLANRQTSFAAARQVHDFYFNHRQKI